MDNQPAGGDPTNPQKPASPRPRIGAVGMLLLLIATLMLGIFLFNGDRTKRSEIDYGFFRQQLRKGNITELKIDGQRAYGKFETIPSRTETAAVPKAVEKGNTATTTDGRKAAAPPNTELPKTDAKEEAKGKAPAAESDKKVTDEKQATPPALLEHFWTNLVPLAGEKLDEEVLAHVGANYSAATITDSTGLVLMFYVAITALLVLGMWLMYRRARDQIMGGGILSGFVKSPARRYETGKKRVTFDDVAGLEGVKTDLAEVVEFLKSPQKFQRLGGRVPKGTLLMGPPGTGKTLLAKAVAGEANVPFFSINGSEFIQMFVGVGAGRVRDMFKTAKEAAPCILFIDEIDAVGRVRGAGLGGGHDEREQTLNQILSEMDGFSPNEAVIVLAATNRPDVLDPALLRPGRFDRHITVDRPNLKARIAIYKVHCREIPLADDVDLARMAGGTVGLTGADIRNLVNEAALWATRLGKDKVDMSDFETARDKILMGPKREEVLTGKEKKMTAYHEAGHALLAWIVPGIDRLHKVTIIPRGRALGVTQLLPEEDRMNIGESELHARLVFMLGGRAAEKLVFDEYSAGAEDDLKRVTQLARRMVTHWGMSERLGPVAYRTSEEHPFLGKEFHEQREFSEHTAQVIDEEVSRLLHGAADEARKLLEKNRGKIDDLANALVEREILDEREIEEIVGPSANQLALTNGKA